MSELPPRLARRAQELDNLPYGLSQKAPVRTVRSHYEMSFKDVLSRREPVNEQEELEFTKLLEGVLDRHRNVGVLGPELHRADPRPRPPVQF